MKNFVSVKFRTYTLIMIVIGFMSSCATPVNLNYDSAQMLKKGDTEIQASGSQYFFEGESLNTNFGGKLGIGVTESYNLKIRIEGLWYPTIEEAPYSVMYLEIDNKFKLGQHMAFSLPLGIYTGEYSMFSIDPRLFITLRGNRNNKVEFTIVPKCHFLFMEGEIAIMPAISAGLGISSDLSKWAIRPEIGYDNYFSTGVGFSYYLKSK